MLFTYHTYIVEPVSVIGSDIECINIVIKKSEHKRQIVSLLLKLAHVHFARLPLGYAKRYNGQTGGDSAYPHRMCDEKES